MSQPTPPAAPPAPDRRSPTQRYAARMAAQMQDKPNGPTQPEPAPASEPPPVEPEPAAEPTPETPEEWDGPPELDPNAPPATEEPTEEPAEESEETPEGETAEAEDASDDTLYAVRVDGEDLEVPLPELIAGYQRQADYSRKTQKLSVERQEHALKVDEFGKQQQQMAQHWRQVGDQLLAEVRGMADADWSALQKDDPEQFNQVQQAIAARQQLGQQVLQMAEQQDQEAWQRRMPLEKAKLVERLTEARIPIGGKPGNWSDPSGFDQGYQALREWAVGTGHVDAERWGRIRDHRDVVLIAKAMAYDTSASEQPVIRKRVKEQVKRVAKPAPAPASAVPPEQAAVAQRRKAFADNPSRGNRKAVLRDYLRKQGAFAQRETR